MACYALKLLTILKLPDSPYFPGSQCHSGRGDGPRNRGSGPDVRDTDPYGHSLLFEPMKIQTADVDS